MGTAGNLPSGWICQSCGTWVGNGQIHTCYLAAPMQPAIGGGVAIWPQSDPQLVETNKLLARIVELLQVIAKRL